VTQLATKEDFAPLGGEYDDALVNLALSNASAFIEGYCNRSFDFVENDVVLLTPNARSICLPGYPVVSVSSVEGYLPNTLGNGMAWTTLTNFGFVPETGFIYDTTGLPGTTWNQCGYTWPWLPASLRVTYSHGYEDVPPGLKAVCMRLANQYLENPSLAMQSKVGEIEDRFSGSVGVRLNEFDQAILDRYADVSIG
jgi:hypothetical protein